MAAVPTVTTVPTVAAVPTLEALRLMLTGAGGTELTADVVDAATELRRHRDFLEVRYGAEMLVRLGQDERVGGEKGEGGGSAGCSRRCHRWIAVGATYGCILCGAVKKTVL